METVPNNDDTVVWQVVLTHGVKLFDHTMINSLIVSKKQDAILRDHNIVNLRKKHFLYAKPYLQLVKETLEWNSYGTACAKISVGYGPTFAVHHVNKRIVSRHQGKVLLFEGRHLLPDNVGCRCKLFEDFHDYLPHQPRLFFSSRDTLRFYGYGAMQSVSDEQSGDVVEYCFAPLIAATAAYKCVTQIKEKEVPLMIFLEYPLLLKAFLDSIIVYSSKDKSLSKFVKVYALEGVTIPDNYWHRKDYFATAMYSSFNKIPKFIRKAIAERYNVQNNKFKKISLFNCLGK